MLDMMPIETMPKRKRYCICDLNSETSNGTSLFMICCDECSVWYHGDCVQVERTTANMIEDWFCPCCIKKNPKLKILYKGRSEVEFSSSAKVSSVPKSSARVSPVAVGPASQVICKQITKLTLFTALLEWKIEEFKTLMELSEIGQSINSHPFFVLRLRHISTSFKYIQMAEIVLSKKQRLMLELDQHKRQLSKKAREDVYFMLVPMHKSDQSRTRVHINLINSKGNGFLIGESGNCKQAEVTKNLQEDESVVISCSVKFWVQPRR